ncbi:MAG: hypothetical protein DMG97_20245 [Acidobacteria bacterium]|nr:MAG: hypothetical protein DMG97_20245 [Acidobacteriota bacterium]
MRSDLVFGLAGGLFVGLLSSFPVGLRCCGDRGAIGSSAKHRPDSRRTTISAVFVRNRPALKNRDIP